MKNQTPAFALRVDASARIGLGHVKRCLALAHALRGQGGAVLFITRDLGVDVKKQVAREGFDCLVLSPPLGRPLDSGVPHATWAGVDQAVDASETAAELSGRLVDWVVVDHYAFDARWHQQVAEATNGRIAVIDDTADRPLRCNVIVDHNVADDHHEKYACKAGKGTPILGGPRYSLLGPAYANAERHALGNEVRSIGIFMGGADAGGYSAIALRACRKCFRGPIEVVSTRDNPHLGALEDAVRQDANTTLALDLPDLSAFFRSHDLHVGAGGGATWERCCMAVPTVAMAVATNQLAVLEPLSAQGAVELVEPLEEAITIAVRGLIEDPSARRLLALRASRLVDGLGASRVAHYLINA
jgi:UDP-2,4-diacetamido-2,4,6-trideoxy-beta-L-altropyranose hydrolase